MNCCKCSSKFFGCYLCYKDRNLLDQVIHKLFFIYVNIWDIVNDRVGIVATYTTYEITPIPNPTSIRPKSNHQAVYQ